MKAKSKNISSLIRQSLTEVYKEERKNYQYKLKAKSGIISKIRFFLFSQPYATSIVMICLLFIGFVAGFIIREWTENAEYLSNEYKLGIRLFYLLIFIAIYAFLPIILELMKPKLKLKWVQLWKDVAEKLFVKARWKNHQEAIYNLSIEKKEYVKNRKYLKFLCQLLWGGIFIGCLPIVEFQQALISLNPIQIIETNWFGGLAICILPFLYDYYYINFEYHIDNIKNAINIIQLTKDYSEDSLIGRYEGQIKISDDFNEEDEEINRMFGIE